MRKNLSDVIDPEIKFSLVEDNSEVDGKHILAKVRGQFFVPDGKSRNDRFYPKSLWEKVIEDPTIKRRLDKRIMFGTIGHDAELNDKAIREGLISHFMTSIEIDENNKGIGEALIINTPTGKILNTVLRAGSELYVSSRANGSFKGKKDGLPVVDEDNYDLDGWDFIIDPGFLEAHPKIAESLNESLKTIEGDDEMENKDGKLNQTLVEHIANENAEIKKKIGDLTDEIKTLEEDKTTLKEENDHLKGEMDKLEDANKLIEKFQKMGTVEEIEEKLKKAEENEKVLEAYNELADSPEDAKESLLKSRDFIKTVVEEFGTVEQLRESAKTSKELSEKVEELGGYDKIKEALEAFDKVLTEKEEKEFGEKVKTLATEFSVSEEKITALLKNHSEDEIRDIYKSVAESLGGDSSRYEKKNFNENNDDNNNNDNDGEISESSILNKSRVDRVNSRLAK